MIKNNTIKKGSIGGIVLLFLIIGYSPCIEAKPSSSGQLQVIVGFQGHQDYPIFDALVILFDKNNHLFVRAGWTLMMGSKTFRFLPVGHTYTVHVIFFHYGHLHSTLVNVTTYDVYSSITIRFQ